MPNEPPNAKALLGSVVHVAAIVSNVAPMFAAKQVLHAGSRSVSSVSHSVTTQPVSWSVGSPPQVVVTQAERGARLSSSQAGPVLRSSPGSGAGKNVLGY